jgi:ribonuclease P protein component
MLPKANRVSRAYFKDILGSRRVYHSPHFVLRVGAATGGRPKVAISVSKKISKSAVTRNAIRRRSYAAVVRHLPTLTPALYLVSAKAGSEKLKGIPLERELVELLKRS